MIIKNSCEVYLFCPKGLTTTTEASACYTLVRSQTVLVYHAPASLFPLPITTTSPTEPASSCLKEPQAEPQALTTPYRFLNPTAEKDVLFAR
ncbi:hypothetical protein FJTKL_02841 [Diaporthe vaccinii]|uniref:Uncharacterized protein n=1 Tax=Diaporthe vaccinii TaxID=105482 RepID=A0ABR4F2R3_9PEZI